MIDLLLIGAMIVFTACIGIVIGYIIGYRLGWDNGQDEAFEMFNDE